jgi:hypothetical protein
MRNETKFDYALNSKSKVGKDKVGKTKNKLVEESEVATFYYSDATGLDRSQAGTSPLHSLSVLKTCTRC